MGGGGGDAARRDVGQPGRRRARQYRPPTPGEQGERPRARAPREAEAEKSRGREADTCRVCGDHDMEASSPPLPVVAPLARLKWEEVDYLSFLRDYALPRVPCIIEGVGEDWPASSKWCSLDYFLSHAGVNLEQEVSASVRPVGAPITYGTDERMTTVGEALRSIQQGRGGGGAEGGGGGGAGDDEDHIWYLSAWNYVAGGSESLEKEHGVPHVFERAPKWLAKHPVLGNAMTDMKWLYIGDKGTGSATHLDTNMSSAWLYIANPTGEKEWRCVHGGDYHLFDHDQPLPDLFDEMKLAKAVKARPQLSRARVYSGVQKAGDVCFNPSLCVHCVRNLAFTISLTHNYIDASNLAPALIDALSSIQSEMLPMVEALGPKKVLRTLQKSLRCTKSKLTRTLVELPDIVADEAIADVVRAASTCDRGGGGREEEEEEAAIAALLTAHLDDALPAEKRDEFRRAATALRDALGLTDAESVS